jgi:lysosomal acid lipase/cholesteryl ester hydrolase
MGVYDLTAEIDYILKNTSEKQIHYVGHSMGSTMFYVLMSVKPEYNTKIRHMVALAPVAFLKNTKTPFASTAKLVFRGVSVKNVADCYFGRPFSFRLHIFWIFDRRKLNSY